MPDRRPNSLSVAIVAGLAALPLAAAIAQDRPPAAAGATVLRGRVTSKAGVPLPGARVRVAIPAADMRFDDPRTPHETIEVRADAEGNYRVELPGIAERTTISVDAMMPGFRRLWGTPMAGGDARKIDVLPGKEAEAALALEPARYISGTVVDEQGRPIPSAQIGAYNVFNRGTGGVERTASGPDGSFEVFNFSVDPGGFKGLPGKGIILFSHPDYITYRVEDIDAIEPDRRGNLRIVLPTGRKVAGTVLGVDGKPISGAMVEAVLDSGSDRKATLTDPAGAFALRGLKGGPTTLTARALPIKQKARLPMALDGDKAGLEVRLQAMALPADLKVHDVLGMRLADLTPELKSAYDLSVKRGALILDPGADFDRLKIGEIAEGYCFWLVGESRFDGVRGFVDRLLAETANAAPTAQEYSVRVVYSFRTPEFVGTNTQYMKLTKDDLKALRELAERLKAGAP